MSDNLIVVHPIGPLIGTLKHLLWWELLLWFWFGSLAALLFLLVCWLMLAVVHVARLCKVGWCGGAGRCTHP